MHTKNTTELIALLQNALDCDALSEHHSGYTAREIHRKCLVHIVNTDKLLAAYQEEYADKDYRIGWGKGKDE